jgi:hypothetical protein
VALLALYTLGAGGATIWTIPLQVAAIGSVAGLVFSLWGWRA